MTERLSHGGFAGVPQRIFDDYDYIPGIEELAESLPERASPCQECSGTGWKNRDCDFCDYGHSVRCECQREEARQIMSYFGGKG